MIQLTIDNTQFFIRPENAEIVRSLCESIRAKNKGRKFKAARPELNMVRQYPKHATNTYDYVCQFEALNYRIFGLSEMTRWAPLNAAPTTHYNAALPVCEESFE